MKEAYNILRRVYDYIIEAATMLSSNLSLAPKTRRKILDELIADNLQIYIIFPAIALFRCIAE